MKKILQQFSIFIILTALIGLGCEEGSDSAGAKGNLGGKADGVTNCPLTGIPCTLDCPESVHMNGAPCKKGKFNYETCKCEMECPLTGVLCSLDCPESGNINGAPCEKGWFNIETCLCALQPKACQEDEDCSDSQGCVQGKCTDFDAIATCDEENTCLGSMECEGGTCVGDGEECLEDDQCVEVLCTGSGSDDRCRYYAECINYTCVDTRY